VGYYREQLYQQAVQYIDTHIGEDIGVQQMAKRLCVSSSTLFRMFRQCAGVGTHHFIRRRKMEHAMSLLKNGCGVAQTAELLGFGSPGYFSLCFKREMGISPGKVRGKEEIEEI